MNWLICRFFYKLIVLNVLKNAMFSALVVIVWIIISAFSAKKIEFLINVNAKIIELLTLI
jgi:hypothetical protein